MAELLIMEKLSTLHCAQCHLLFAMPVRFESDRRNDHASFFCPSGHKNFYSAESEAEKLRRERDRLTQRVAEKDDEIRRQRGLREAAERQRNAARGQVTKIKNRVGHGVCPCCNRTFENVARHMASQHPTFTAEAAE